MTTQILTQERLKSLLDYDPETGVFTNRKTRTSAKIGAVAGSVTEHGYIAFQIDGKKIYAHRAAWLYVHGCWPPLGFEVDHINRHRDDNRISNLRLATSCQNSQNVSVHTRNTSGHRGVTWHRRNQKWQVQMRVNHKIFYVGLYDFIDYAVQARAIAEIFLHRKD